MAKRKITIFSILLLGFGLHAQADEPAVEAPPPPPPWVFSKPAGKLNNNFTLYPQRITGIPDLYHRIDLELEESVSNSTWTAKAVPWTWVRTPDTIGGLDRAPRAYFEMKEGWVERIGPEADIRVGNQIITWGAADQINPTDNWNPRDFADPLNPTKLPMPTAKFNLHPTTHPDEALEVLATPFFRESRLPVTLGSGTDVAIKRTDSRWLQILPSRVTLDDFSAPLYYKIGEPSYPATWQAGTRLQALRISGWDFSLSYFNGVEKIPRMTFTRKGDATNPALPITITVLPSFHREQVVGTDGAGSVDIKNETFGTRYEIAYHIRNNVRARRAEPQFQPDLIKDDYVMGVFGVDHTMKKQIKGTVLYFNAMYIRQFSTSNREVRPGGLTVEGLPNTNPFDENFVLYVEDRINSTLKVSNAIIASFRGLDALNNTSISYSFTDNFKSALGYDWFFGRKTGFYGQFADDSRFTLNASYTF